MGWCCGSWFDYNSLGGDWVGWKGWWWFKYCFWVFYFGGIGKEGCWKGEC